MYRYMIMNGQYIFPINSTRSVFVLSLTELTAYLYSCVSLSAINVRH